MSKLIYFKHNGDEFLLFHIAIHFWRNNHRFITNTTSSIISFLCICFVADNQYPIDIGIIYRLLHECVLVMTFFEVIYIQDNINTISNKPFGKFNDTFLYCP